MKLTWQDVEDIAAELARHHADRDPLRLPLSEVKALVTALPTFGDDPAAATPPILEAIQAAWYDEAES